MRDEKYEFLTDCREKKSTAQSAFKRRTHTGKSGCTLPHEKLSKKELNKMNGKTKTYRLNDPMSWTESKSMPDDLKIMYIKALRKKYNVPVRRLAIMMGVDSSCLNREIIRLGIGEGMHSRAGNTPWDKDGFYAWCGLLPEAKAPAEETPEEAPTPEPETVAPEAPENLEAPQEEAPEVRRVIPTHGNMIFDGLVEDILETVKLLLSGANVHLHITWDTI